jgi:hypothetical protein
MGLLGPLSGLRQRLASYLHNSAAADEAILINQGRILAEQARLRAGATLADFEFKVFSQWGEDGIIQRLVREVPIAHRTFVEFGVEDFSEANCRFLMHKDNWRGLVIDGSDANIARLRRRPWFWQHDLQARPAFITPDNIDSLIGDAGFDRDLGLLSVDIDGMDYWVLSAIRAVRPRLLIVEYNSVFGPERAISVPRADDFFRTSAHPSNLYYGASLAAFEHWAQANDYGLVGTNSAGCNAFFVRNDVRPVSLPLLSAGQAFNDSRYRESRDADGALTYVAGPARAALIAGLPVVDVRTGRTEPF